MSWSCLLLNILQELKHPAESRPTSWRPKPAVLTQAFILCNHVTGICLHENTPFFCTGKMKSLDSPEFRALIRSVSLQF